MTSLPIWGTSRLAPLTIPASLPVTQFSTGGTPMARFAIHWLTPFCCYATAAAVIAPAITSSNRNCKHWSMNWALRFASLTIHPTPPSTIPLDLFRNRKNRQVNQFPAFQDWKLDILKP